MRTHACVLVLVAASMSIGSGPLASADASTGYCAPPTDTVPPAITGVALSRRSVDLRHGPQTVTVTVQAEDKSAGIVSGVHSIRVALYRAREEKDIHLALTSGTSADGTWRGLFRFSRHDMSGTWHLRLFQIRDAAGNEIFYIRNVGAAPDQPYDPRLHPDWASTVTVSGTPGKAWLHSGHPVALTMTPRAINTTKRAGAIHVRTRISGPTPRVVQFQVGAVDLHTGHFVGRIHLTRRGKVWSGSFPVPRWVGTGRRQVMVIARYHPNVRPRDRFSYPSKLIAHGLNPTLKIVSGRETSTPTLTNFTFMPTSVDTTTQSRLVNVTADTQSQSGPAAIYVRFAYGTTKPVPIRAGPAPSLPPRAHALTNDVGTSNEPFVRLVPDGTSWSGSLTIPGCVTNGVWKAGVYIQDQAGRHRDYDDAALRNAGLPDTLNVTSNEVDTDAPGVSSVSADATTHTISVSFSPGVFNIAPAALTVYRSTPAGPQYESPLSIAGISCRTADVAIACNGSAGAVSTAVLQVPSVVAGETYEVWANLNQVIPPISDAEGYAVDPEYGPQGTATA
ncbi:MAG TPA: hypothetical protein VHC43_05590 [Mycobacteriales bacterium]|nr:hypothetical protein [Mycobacteriales bacterium]